MAIKVFSILISFFSLALVFLSMQDFYFIDLTPPSIDFKDIQTKNISLYELNSSQIKNNYQIAEWVRYKNKDVFNNFMLFGYDYNISSNQVRVIGNEVDEVWFLGNVSYLDINQTKIIAKELVFNNKNKTLSTTDEFTAFKGLSKIQGTSLNYSLNDRQLQIQGIKAWFLKN